MKKEKLSKGVYEIEGPGPIIAAYGIKMKKVLPATSEWHPSSEQPGEGKDCLFKLLAIVGGKYTSRRFRVGRYNPTRKSFMMPSNIEIFLNEIIAWAYINPPKETPCEK